MHCEEQLSDYLENALGAAERNVIELHLRECSGCSGLVTAMTEVLDLARTFPVYAPPSWLPTRILANTPRRVRETWSDTLTGMVRWAAQPHIAMAVFTSILVLTWMSSLAGISPGNVATVVRDPAVLYYEAGTLANRIYGDAVRSYYRTPLVTQIQAQIERLREIS